MSKAIEHAAEHLFKQMRTRAPIAETDVCFCEDGTAIMVYVRQVGEEWTAALVDDPRFDDEEAVLRQVLRELRRRQMQVH